MMGVGLEGIRLGIVSQTPLIRLLKRSGEKSIDISKLRFGEYSYTVGGVAPLVKAEIDELIRQGAISKAVWFTLNPDAPRDMILSDKVRLINVYMGPKRQQAYANFKEEVWKDIHNIDSRDFTTDEYFGYVRYNSKVAEMLLRQQNAVDLYVIHDFQQLLLGALIGPSTPSILRWHPPFNPDVMSAKIRKFVVNGLEANDAVIVSTKRDLEGLIKAGYKGTAYQLYPNLDNTKWERPTRAKLAEFCDRYGIKKDDFLVLNIARMDQMKSQDDLIKALGLLKDKRIKLMLVGNGSFTSSTKGLGHPKARLWREKLNLLVKRLDLSDRVIFTGHLDHGSLECAYGRANVFVLPSRMEGFGLVVVEAWIYGVPAIVSNGAGVSELITDGLNSFTFNAGDHAELAEKIRQLYKGPKITDEMRGGLEGLARICYTNNTVPTLKSIYEKTIAGFK